MKGFSTGRASTSSACGGSSDTCETVSRIGGAGRETCLAEGRRGVNVLMYGPDYERAVLARDDRHHAGMHVRGAALRHERKQLA